VVDPSRLVDHVEIEVVVDPKAVPIVFDLVLSIKDAFYSARLRLVRSREG